MKTLHELAKEAAEKIAGQFNSGFCDARMVDNFAAAIEEVMKDESCYALLKNCRPVVEAAIHAAVRENFGYCDEMAHKLLDLRNEIDAVLTRGKK